MACRPGWNSDKDRGRDRRGLHEGLFVFQLDCTQNAISFFLRSALAARCQWPVPRNGDVLRNQFFSCSLCHPLRPSLTLSAIRENSFFAVCEAASCTGKHSGASCVHCQAAIPARLSLFVSPCPFSTRFVSVGVQQTPVPNSVIYFAYVCQWRHAL